MKLFCTGAVLFILGSAFGALEVHGAVKQILPARGEVLEDIRELTLKCVVQPYHVDEHGRRHLHALKSVCAELVPTPSGAVIQLPEGTLHAFLTESDDTDGGDVAHLIVVNQKADVVAIRRNVVSFGNIFIALTGGEENFPQYPVH